VVRFRGGQLVVQASTSQLRTYRSLPTDEGTLDGHDRQS